MRFVQLHHPEQGRRVALVEKGTLLLLAENHRSLYDLLWEGIVQKKPLKEQLRHLLTDTALSYDAVYTGREAWKLLPSFDHPRDPMHCVVSGTGLTHKTSAENRASMHRKLKEQETLSDSMKIYLWGEEGGKPGPGTVGVQPEWFYKGNGTVLRGHGEPLEIPAYALDGGEEPEIAGVYVVDPGGMPCRIGMTIANEFSDHVMEQQNYLYLAPSKLRNCAIGPELVIHPEFGNVEGRVTLLRKGEVFWEKQIKTGESNSTHSLANLEHHHFKYAQHRIPGQVHIHFFGTSGLSFSEGIQLAHGDEMAIAMEGFGRPLRNPVVHRKDRMQLVQVYDLK